MKPLILRTLKDRKASLIIFCMAGVLLLTLYITLFPTIQKQSQQFSKLLESFPQGMLKVLNVDDLNFSTVEKFLAVEEYSFTWPLLVVFLAVSFGGSIVRDIEKGTIDFALSRPISRFVLYTGRALASLVAVCAFVVASILMAIPIAAIAGIDIVVGNHLVMAFTGLVFGASIVGIASLFSALFSERGRAYGATGGVLVLMYMLNVIAKLNDGLSGLQYLSLFHYFDAGAALTKGEFGTGSFLVLLGVALLTLAGGALIFQRRDINAAA